METPMTYETLLVEQRGAVTLITLNRPQALNALNSQLLADLITAFAAFDADDSQRCAVLTGSKRLLRRVRISKKWHPSLLRTCTAATSSPDMTR